MHIEFTLPNDAGIAPTMLLLRRELVDWGIKYAVSYTEEFEDDLVKVTLHSAEDYSIFAVTWQPKSYSARTYCLVE